MDQNSTLKCLIDRFKTRTLRVDILTLFLSLFIVTFGFVIIFTYIREKKSIDSLALETVKQASAIILEKAKAMIKDANRFPKIMDGVIWKKEEISCNNEELILFMLETVQVENNFAHIFVSSLDGNFLGASDLEASSQSNFITDSSRPLPPTARYSLLCVDNRSEPPQNKWFYYDNDLKLIDKEENTSHIFDPRTRPWFKGALAKKGLYWSDVYTFFSTGDKGISTSQPLLDKEGNVIGVLGVDLSFFLLSHFLSNLHVGKTGEVFLLTGNGEELISEKHRHEMRTIPKEVVETAYHHFQETQKHTFLLENNHIKYLAYITHIPVISDKEWLIVVLVPQLDFFADIQHTESIVSIITFLVLIFAGIAVFYFSKRISLPIVELSREVDKIKHLDLSSKMRVKSHIKEIILMDASIAAMRNGLLSFIRYVPKRIVMQLIQKGEEITLGGEKKEITIFFSDIAGFTSFSEDHSVEAAMTVLSEYFDGLSKIIIKEEGTIDKYIGDSIMAFWGAPLEIPDHAIRACNAAIKCQFFLHSFNQKRVNKGEPELLTRIAINTGNVIVGNIGTQERMNYTVIGDIVNAAAHLQQVNKIYHTQTLITEETWKKTNNAFLVRPLDIVAPTGKKTKIKIYELFACLQGDPEYLATEQQRELCDLFTQGFDAFYAQEYERAQGLFSSILKKFPDDFPTQMYLERLVHVMRKDTL
jgi:adenylate cyclase